MAPIMVSPLAVKADHPRAAGRRALTIVLAAAIVAAGTLVSAPVSVASPTSSPELVPFTGTRTITATWGAPSGGYHPDGQPAIDVAMPVGSPIYAAGTGRVTFTAVDPRNCNPNTYPGGIQGCINAGMQGTRIHIVHPDGLTSRYYHLNGIAAGIGSGTNVNAGQLIGWSGNSGISTGPHLHYDERNASNVAVHPGNWTACHGSSQVIYDNIQARKGQAIRNDGYACSTARPIRGSVDEAISPAPGQLRVRGWAFDEDAPTTSIRIHVYVGGAAGDPAAEGFDIGAADVSRPDVGAAYPGVGNNHGYDRTLNVAKFGNQPVYVYAINAPGTPGDNVLIASRTVHIPQPNPFGSLDSVQSPRPGWLRVSGWAADPSSPTTSLAVHIYGGTKYLASITADQSRPDVGAAFPGYGNLHGYDSNLAAPPGTYSVCTYGINIGVGNNNTQLGCKEVTVVADTTAPDTTITSQPAPSGTATTVAFAFASNEPGTTFTCQWDGSPWAPCTSPTTRGLSVGAHTFAVRATDPAGNTDPSPATSAFTITAPALSPTPTPTATAPEQMKAPTVVVRGRRVIVKWKAAEPNGSPITRYLVDISKGKDKTLEVSARKTVFKRLRPGRYRIRIAARNAVGTSPYSAWVKVRVRA
jgi:murein DD-endopeptidase MepM/ murein hydrolase activator NlpD